MLEKTDRLTEGLAQSSGRQSFFFANEITKGNASDLQQVGSITHSNQSTNTIKYPRTLYRNMAHRGHIVIPQEKELSDTVAKSVKRQLTDTFGGVSVYEGSGMWLSRENGERVGEEHVRMVVTTREPKSALKKELQSEAQFVAYQLKEEAVLIEIEETDMDLVSGGE